MAGRQTRRRTLGVTRNAPCLDQLRANCEKHWVELMGFDWARGGGLAHFECEAGPNATALAGRLCRTRHPKRLT